MSDSELLWHSFTITQVMDCIADPSKHRVVAELSDDISPAFPYLNAVQPHAMYNPGANSFTVRNGVRILTFYPHVATLAKVNYQEDALAQLEWFRDLCNQVWARRHEIEPRYERRVMLGPLDVYLLLPRLNCKDCGEATCMAFGFGILLGKRTLGECLHLVEPMYEEGGRRLTELLGA
jgi:ArsR family metal-binding transcriptional regulator